MFYTCIDATAVLGLILVAYMQVQHTHLCHHATPLNWYLEKPSQNKPQRILKLPPVQLTAILNAAQRSPILSITTLCSLTVSYPIDALDQPNQNLHQKPVKSLLIFIFIFIYCIQLIIYMIWDLSILHTIVMTSYKH